MAKKRDKTLRELGEVDFLSALRNRVSTRGKRLVGGLHDDCAALPVGGAKDRFTLLTEDLLVEGVHFRRDLTGPYDLGWKSLMVNVSDVAAMAGRPGAFIVGLGAPGETRQEWLDAFYAGLQAAAKASGAYLAGGDTVKAPQLVISISLMGEFRGAKDRIPLRSKMRAKDYLYVTGTPGDSAAGLEILLHPEKYSGLAEKHRKALIRRHLRPAARLKEAQALGAHLKRWALIDLSDDLAFSLERLAEVSGRGYRVELDALPLSAALRRFCEISGRDALEWALFGGEDYELLLACAEPPEELHAIFSKARLKTRLTCIGRATTGEKGFVRDGRPVEIGSEGFAHF